ncbi:MAG: LapA family protein [Thermoanaerobaculia bacterium]
MAIALAAVVAIFALQNSSVIMVSFMAWHWEASLALVLILVLGAGILVGYLAGLPSAWKNKAELRQHRREIADLEKEATGRELEESAEE